MTDNVVITLTGIPHPKPSGFEPATVWLWSIDYKGETFSSEGAYSRESGLAAAAADEKHKWLVDRDHAERQKARKAANILGAG